MSFSSNELEPDYDSGDVPNFAGVGVRQFRGGGGSGDASALVSPGGIAFPLGAAPGGTPTSEFFPTVDEPYMFHSHARLSCGRFPRFTKQTANPAAGPKAVTPTPIFMRPPSVFSASSAPARMARLVDTPLRVSPSRNNTSPYVPQVDSPVGSPEPDMSASFSMNYAASQSIPDGLVNMANPPMLYADQRSHSADELPTSALLMRRVRQSPKPAEEEEREVAFGMPAEDTPTPSALEQAGVVSVPPESASAVNTPAAAAPAAHAVDPAAGTSAGAAPAVADQPISQDTSTSLSPTPTRAQAPVPGLVPLSRLANEGTQRDPWDSTSPSTQSLATPGTSVDSPRMHSNSPQAMMPPPVPSTENVHAAETSPDTVDARHRSGLDALDDFLWQNPDIYSDADALSLDDASRYSAASRVKSSKVFSGAPPSLQMVAELRDRDSVASSFRGPPVPPKARASMVILDAGETPTKGGTGARSANHVWTPSHAKPASEEELPPLPPKDHLLRVLQSQGQTQDSTVEEPRVAAEHGENEAHATNGFGMVPLGEQTEVPVIALGSHADEPPALGAPASGEPLAAEKAAPAQDAAPASEVITPAVDVTPPAGEKPVLGEGDVSSSGMRLLNQGGLPSSEAGNGEIPVIPLGARSSANTPPFSAPRMADEIPSISLGTPKGPRQPTVTEIPEIPLHSFPDRTPTRTPETSAWQHGIRPKCQRCQEPIRRFAVRSLDNVLTGLYHRECFDCEVCHARFPDSVFYVHEGKPHCHQHYHERCGVLCTVCGKGVESVYRKVGTDANYHLQCLSCEFEEDDSAQVCGMQLSDFYLIQGRRYCESHAFKMLEKHSAQQGVPATLERRTSMLVN